MILPWTAAAREELHHLQSRDGGWGYRAAGESSVEPTVLASLGLLATDTNGESLAAVREAANWVAALQQPDGRIGPSASLTAPGWPVPLAVLLWRTVGICGTGRKLAVSWLLRREGKVFTRKPDDPAGHDTSIPGWPWVAETHPWLEPTAIAVLALRAEGHAGHARVRQGLRLIRNRAIPGGGWNYGNSLALGKLLRPQPAPTGLALLALAGIEPASSRIVQTACDYLEQTLPGTRSPQTLCWGLWGLEVWGRRPADASEWLAEAYKLVDRRPDPVLQLGYLLTGSTSPLPVFAPRERSS